VFGSWITTSQAVGWPASIRHAIVACGRQVGMSFESLPEKYVYRSKKKKEKKKRL
jgi:hypothetical protein